MFIKKVKKYCLEHNLTTRGFEKLCGLTNGTVSKWGGTFGPSIPTLKKIAKATNIPIEEWLED